MWGIPERSSRRSFRGHVQILVRRSCGDLGEIFSKRSLNDLVQALEKILLLEVRYEDFHQGLVKVLVRRSRRAPGEIF